MCVGGGGGRGRRLGGGRVLPRNYTAVYEESNKTKSLRFSFFLEFYFTSVPYTAGKRCSALRHGADDYLSLGSLSPFWLL